MTISIIVSTYNGEEHIIEQLESIRTQKRAADEVLIFDDDSEDDTVSLVQNFIAQNQLQNWKLTKNSQNKGWRRNFMDGIAKASGELIFPCDQDDIWNPDKLQAMHDIMETHSEIDLLTSNYSAFYDNGDIIIKPEKNNGKLEKKSAMLNLLNTPYPGCTYCIRKTFAESCALYWEADFPHDALFWRIATFANTAYAINKSLINWRRHQDSTFAQESIQSKSYKSKLAWMEYAERVILSLQHFLDKSNISNTKERSILHRNSEWLKIRRRFYEDKHIFDGIRLLCFLPIYPRKRQFLGDWYLVYFKSPPHS